MGEKEYSHQLGRLRAPAFNTIMGCEPSDAVRQQYGLSAVRLGNCSARGVGLLPNPTPGMSDISGAVQIAVNKYTQRVSIGVLGI